MEIGIVRFLFSKGERGSRKERDFPLDTGNGRAREAARPRRARGPDPN
jgi:hypothetical protein